MLNILVAWMKRSAIHRFEAVDSGGNSSACIHPTSSSIDGRLSRDLLMLNRDS